MATKKTKRQTDETTEPTGLAITAVDELGIDGEGIEAKVERVEALTNGEAHVERLPFDLSKLDEDGILVDMDKIGFSRLYTRLGWEALGVELDGDAGKQISSPGIT